MKIDRRTWETVRDWKNLGLPWGFVELPNGTMVSSEMVYYTFFYGFDFLLSDERLDWIVLSDYWEVTDYGTSLRCHR